VAAVVVTPASAVVTADSRDMLVDSVAAPAAPSLAAALWADRAASQAFTAERASRAETASRTDLTQVLRTLPSCTMDFITGDSITGIVPIRISIPMAFEITVMDTVADGAGAATPGGDRLTTIRGGGGIRTISDSMRTLTGNTRSQMR